MTFGTVPPGELLLSFCIPTYKRAPKLARLLEQMVRVLEQSAFRDAVEIVISDNASPDKTDEVCRTFGERLAPLCHVRVLRQAENVGMMRNFQLLYEQARGSYVCLWGDDDGLYDTEFDPLLHDLSTIRPELCVSSFNNYKFEGDRVRLDGQASVMVTDLEPGVRHLLALGKISQYVYRRRDLTPHEKGVSDRGRMETEFWFITLSVLLFTHHQRTLLLRSAEIGWSDRDSHDLRFSPRAYGTIKEAALLGLDDQVLRAEFARKLPEPITDLIMVGILFRHAIGRIRLQPDIARMEHAHLMENLPRLLFAHWRTFVKIPFILVLYPLTRWRDAAAAGRIDR
ncbi:MAG: glycosyltransferase family 2 protein [Gemmatimonadaceae bacterium]|nr:glycosyltransferase family 2 protein [Gemmatimonadaceae bacterium]